MEAIGNIIADLIFQPGSSLKLVPAINLSVLALLVVLCTLTYSKIDSIHIIVMATLALGLLASVNWVFYEVQKAKAEAASGSVATTTDSSQSATNHPKCD